MEKLLINNIYHAIEGEGARIGTPQVFVRLQGCTVGCLNCDSKETWEFKGEPVEVDEIKKQIDSITGGNKYYWISLTGGDPLHPKHEAGLIELARKLKENHYLLNIEASGTRFPKELFSYMDFISCDFKTPSTGVRTPYKVLEDVMLEFRGRYQIKSVISDRRDFDAAVKMYQELFEKTGEKPTWFLTPCFETGSDAPVALMNDIYSWVRECPSDFRVIAQQHKFVYGSMRLDV